MKVSSDNVRNEHYDRSIAIKNGKIVETRVYRRPTPVHTSSTSDDIKESLPFIICFIGFIILLIIASLLDSMVK